MNAEALRENGKVFSLHLTARCGDDRDFLTRLYKALMLNDEITIEIGEGKVMSYYSGAEVGCVEKMTWKSIAGADSHTAKE